VSAGLNLGRPGTAGMSMSLNAPAGARPSPLSPVAQR
jgi:hypothetical protein